MFRLDTLSLLIIGLVDIPAGIAVCFQANSFDWYNGGFVGIGILLILLAFIGNKIRYAPNGITWYLCLIFISF